MATPSPNARLDILLSEASLSHLSAAAALSKQGYRVCVLQGEQSEGIPPWALPPLGLLPPANAGTLLDELFTTCDIPPPLRRSFRSPKTLFQIVWPGVRADVQQNQQAHETGLVREFGEGEARKMLQFEQKLADSAATLFKAIMHTPVFPPSGFFSSYGKGSAPEGLPKSLGRELDRPVSELFREARLSEEAQRYFRLYLAASSFLFQDDPSAAAAAAVLNPHTREHSLLPPEDSPELRDILAVQIARRGVNLGRGATRGIEKAAEGTWEVETTENQVYRTRALVEGEGVIQSNLQAKGTNYRRSMTLKISLDAVAIPVGICPRGVLLAGDGTKWQEGEMLFWSLERPAEPGAAARLWATVLAGEGTGPNGNRPSTEPGLPNEDLRKKVLTSLEQLLPFLPDYLIKSAWLPGTSEATWLSGPTRSLGLVGAGLKAGRRARYALGKSNLPALGVWGEVKSALSLANLIEKKLG